MKSLKEYLPESFLIELEEEPHDSSSPISGKEATSKPNPAESKYGHRELGIGDPVIITGRVEFEGKTGYIVDFGQDNHFVVVNLYNHGRHSFHASNVAYNDYADNEDENADDDRELDNWRKLSGYNN